LFDNIEPSPGEYPAFDAFHLQDKNRVSGVTKWRQIYAPNQPMRRVHHHVIKELRHLQHASWGRSPWATAVLPGSSPLGNVERHRRKRYLYLLDLHSAYDNVDVGKLSKILARLESGLSGLLFSDPTDVAQIYCFLKRYCMSPSGGLMTGAPSSPDLFNIYADERLDRPISRTIRKWGLTYSRYLDDLTFSSDSPIGERKRAAILNIIRAAGFDISYRKAKVYDLTKSAVSINGIGLDLNGRTFVPRHFLRKINHTIYLAKLGLVSPERVAGYMGVYWSSTPRDHNHRNQSERHTLVLFNDYQACLRRLRRQHQNAGIAS
jgi:RNA-directed DNA polymerase